MNLEPRTSEPGLFQNPEWRETEPGTFAVIIGVSRYRHLGGGETPVSETYGLGQLAVSALTAYEVFRWLTDSYFVEGAPLAKCWMLLAPTVRECEFEPRLASGMTEPTFENLRNAIGYWWQTAHDLPQEAAKQSRVFFFFSGHGVEIHQEQQILLPSDYLRPPARSWNDAISTANVKQAFASLQVPHQFFFLDACRNGHAELRKKIVTGSPILNEDDSASVNPALVAPLLFATAAGQQAFQQPDPGKGLSLFGSALLDGLSGKPDIEMSRKQDLYCVNLYPLQAFVKQRVVDLLTKSGETVVQPVKLSGVVDNAPVTFLKPATIRAGRMPVAGGFGRVLREPPRIPSPQERAAKTETAVRKQLAVSMPISPELNRSFRENEYSVGHDIIFGSENATTMWSKQKMKLFALGMRTWIAPESVVLLNVSHDRETRSYRVEFEFGIKDQSGYWIQFQDASNMAWGCVLPNEGGAALRYVIEFDMAFNQGEGRQITRLDSFLSVNNESNLGSAAQLWEQYRNGDTGEAVRSFLDLNQVQQLVREKLESPLSATAAGLILLRANRLDLLSDWLRNLANWFPGLPDGAVLWAEQLMRQSTGRGGEVLDAAAYLARLADSRLPITSEAFAYASQLTGTLLRKSVPLPPDLRRSVEALQSRVASALPYFQPGGLFASFAGFDPDIHPASLIGGPF